MASSIRKSKLAARIRLGLGVLLLIFGGESALRADLDAYTTPKIKKKGPSLGVIAPTASADAATGEVDRGGQITLRLRGIASGGGQVEFRLIQKPQHGRILRSKQVAMDTLEVVYRHSGERLAPKDTFIFGVRAGGVGPFSPGEAVIRIKDVQGRLLAPEVLEFPPVLVGSFAEDAFVLANDGGAALEGRIEVSPPWQISDPQKYALAPGEKRKIVVRFMPDRGGAFEGRIVFQGSERTVVELIGQGTAPFAASPAKLSLAPDLAGKRSGSVLLQNNSSGPTEIQIDSKFDLPKSLVLQFGETKELTLEDNGIGVMNSTITLSSGAYSTRILVSATERVQVRPVAEQASASPTPLPETPTPTPALVQNSPTPAPTPAEPTPVAVTLPAPAAFPATITPTSGTAIRLEWKTFSRGTYAIEQRYLLLDDKKNLTTKWVPVPEAKIRLTQDQGVAEINGLDPATNFTFRIVHSDDTFRRFSQILTYRSPAVFWKRLDFRWLLYLGAAGLFFLIARNRWQTRAQSW